MLVVISTNIQAVNTSDSTGCGVSLNNVEFSLLTSTAYATENGIICNCSDVWWIFGNKKCLASNNGNRCGQFGQVHCQETNSNCGGTDI